MVFLIHVYTHKDDPTPRFECLAGGCGEKTEDDIDDLMDYGSFGDAESQIRYAQHHLRGKDCGGVKIIWSPGARSPAATAELQKILNHLNSNSITNVDAPTDE